MNIIFGTKKLGQIQTAATSEKYPGIPVITVEGLKGAKKSRRILLNKTAAELLNCEVGDVQHLRTELLMEKILLRKVKQLHHLMHVERYFLSYR